MTDKKNIVLAAFAVTALAAFVVFLIVRWNAFEKNEPAPRIGIILPLGTTLEEGAAMEKAIRMAAEEWNAKGGIGGKPVEILARDGNCDRGRARLAVEELVLKLRVPYLIGGLCGAEAEGAAEGAGEKAVVISPVAPNASLSKKNDNVFLLASPQGGEMPALTRYLVRKLKKPNAVLLFQNSELSRFSAEAFEKSMTDAGGRIRAKASFAPRSVEPEDAANAVTANEDDTLFLISEIPAYTERLLLAVKRKYPDLDIFVPATTLEHALDQPAFEGVGAVRPAVDVEMKSLKDFESRYESRYGEAASFPLGQAAAYDALNLFLKAIDAKGYADFGAVRDAIASTRRYEGASGPITLDSNGNVVRSYEIIRWRSGAIESVETLVP